MIDLYNFYFVKLMQTIQSTNIFAITARFTSETRGVTTEFDGKFLLFDQDIAVDIGQWHFSRWDEEQIVCDCSGTSGLLCQAIALCQNHFQH